MVMSAFTVIRESITILLNQRFNVTFTLWTILPLVAVVLLKFILWMYCRRFKYSPIAMALAEDHANDVASNAMAVCAGLSLSLFASLSPFFPCRFDRALSIC